MHETDRPYVYSLVASICLLLGNLLAFFLCDEHCVWSNAYGLGQVTIGVFLLLQGILGVCLALYACLAVWFTWPYRNTIVFVIPFFLLLGFFFIMVVAGGYMFVMMLVADSTLCQLPLFIYLIVNISLVLIWALLFQIAPSQFMCLIFRRATANRYSDDSVMSTASAIAALQAADNTETYNGMTVMSDVATFGARGR